MLEKVCQFDLTYGFQGFLLHVIWRFHQGNYILFILRTLLILPVIYAASHLMHVRGKYSTLLELRYVGVIWFLFHVLQLLMIKLLPNETCVALANLQRSITKNLIEHWTSHDVLNSYWKCMFVDSFTELIGPQLCSLLSVESLIESGRHSPISFKHVSLWCYFLWSSPNHTPIKEK